jgi:hypothetical protein
MLDLDKEIIRRAPKGSVHRLAALFEVSAACIKRIRNGSRGLPGQNGLGMRPWEIHTRDLIETWRTRQLARIEAAYQRALASVDNDEPITLEPETTEEAVSRLPDAPGSVVLFRGALVRKPPAPPIAPSVPMQAKSKGGLFYDRR